MDHNHTPSFFFSFPQWNLWDVGWLGAPVDGGAYELDDDDDEVSDPYLWANVHYGCGQEEETPGRDGVMEF